MRERTVSSVSQFVSLIADIGSDGYSFFRGQTHLNRKMLPSLLRVNEPNGTRQYSDNCDQSLMASFKSRAIPYLDQIPELDVDWMCIAQHYGMPTRLLDWSQSPLVALFFAVEKSNLSFEEGDCPVVWCLKPVELNLKGRFLGERVDVPNLMENDDTLNTCLKANYGIGVRKDHILYPIALSGPLNNERVNAQKGVFTLFPLNAKPLEEMDGADDILYKIKISRDNVQEIKKELYNLGIRHSSVYPELSSISLDIVYEYKQ